MYSRIMCFYSTENEIDNYGKYESLTLEIRNQRDH